MKSFREILKEAKQGNRPSVETSVSTNVPRRKRSKSTELTKSQIERAWKSGSEGKPSVMATSSKPEGGTWFGSSKRDIETGQEALRQQVRDTIAKNRGGSAELQAAQSSGPKETMVGKGAKSGTGETYRANRPSETRATGVSSKKGRISGSVSKGNIKFSGDTKYKEMLAKLPNAPKKTPRVGAPVATTKVVKQAEVSKEIAKKTADYKTERGEEAYRKAKLDQEVRRQFPTGKGGLKADETNPHVDQSKRIGRAKKVVGSSNVWDQPKISGDPLKGMGGKKPTKTTYPSFFKASIPNIQTTKKSGAPDRTSTRQAIRNLRKSRNIGISVKNDILGTPKKETIPVSKPTKPVTSNPSSGYSFENKPKVGSEIVVAKKSIPSANLGRKGQSYDPLKKIGDIVKSRRTSSPAVSSSGLAVKTPSLPAKQDVIDVKVREIKPEKPKQFKSPTQPQPQQPQMTAKSFGSEVSKSISKAQNRGRVGAGGILSALGAAQEYEVGSERAKREGKGKLGQAFRGAARAAGAFTGGVAGTAIGGRVAGSVGAIGGGALGYSKGADFGSRVAKAVEKSSAAKWLAKTAKKYVPGIA